MNNPKKAEWPKLARGPQGNTAMFQCRGDVPAGWVVVGEEASIVDPAPPKFEPPADWPLKDTYNALKAKEDKEAAEATEYRAAYDAYAEAFGKKPHHRMGTAAIRAKIAAKG